MKNIAETSRRMNSFIESVKRGTYSITSSEHSSVLMVEALAVRDILAYKARLSHAIISITGDEHSTVTAHPVRTQQLFINLISNALDACVRAEKAGLSHEKTVHISISKEDSRTWVIVRDNGCGISQKYLNTIWNNSFSTKNANGGIGLSTVRDIVEKDLEGSISVESIENIGTTFSIYIPHKQTSTTN